MKKYITPGLILILAGLYFLVDALPGVDLPGSVFFLAVGLALLIARLTTGRYGPEHRGLCRVLSGARGGARWSCSSAGHVRHCGDAPLARAGVP